MIGYTRANYWTFRHIGGYAENGSIRTMDCHLDSSTMLELEFQTDCHAIPFTELYGRKQKKEEEETEKY
jgi:hypothetical protein